MTRPSHICGIRIEVKPRAQQKVLLQFYEHLRLINNIECITKQDKYTIFLISFFSTSN